MPLRNTVINDILKTRKCKKPRVIPNKSPQLVLKQAETDRIKETAQKCDVFKLDSLQQSPQESISTCKNPESKTETRRASLLHSPMNSQIRMNEQILRAKQFAISSKLQKKRPNETMSLQSGAIINVKSRLIPQKPTQAYDDAEPFRI